MGCGEWKLHCALDGRAVKAFTATEVFIPPNAMEELSPKKAMLFLQWERGGFVSVFPCYSWWDSLCCHPVAVRDGFKFLPGCWALWAERCSEVLEFPPAPLLGVCPGHHKQTPGQWWRHWCCNGRQILKGNLSWKFQLVPQSIIHLRSSHTHLLSIRMGQKTLLGAPEKRDLFQGCQNFQWNTAWIGLMWLKMQGKGKNPLCLEMELSLPPQTAHPAPAAHHTPHMQNLHESPVFLFQEEAKSLQASQVKLH